MVRRQKMVKQLWILDPKIKISSPIKTKNLWSKFQTWFFNSMFCLVCFKDSKKPLHMDAPESWVRWVKVLGNYSSHQKRYLHPSNMIDLYEFWQILMSHRISVNTWESISFLVNLSKNSRACLYTESFQAFLKCVLTICHSVISVYKSGVK